ncbi:MAG: DUF3090 family protein [Dehalococcoidia bacterium]
MSKASYELGMVSRVNVEALGEPGKRTFRLLVDSPIGSAVLWLEKEQLLEMGLYIKQALAQAAVAESESPTPHPEPAPGNLSVEFKVGKLALEYVDDQGLFRFWNHDIEAEEQEDAKLGFEATSSQATALSDEALKVCAAGRPLCPLCHQSMDAEGHLCARSNGHRPADQGGPEEE